MNEDMSYHLLGQGYHWEKSGMILWVIIYYDKNNIRKHQNELSSLRTRKKSRNIMHEDMSFHL